MTISIRSCNLRYFDGPTIIECSHNNIQHVQLCVACNFYTASHKKTCHLIIVHNFDICWPIFKIFSLLDSSVNLPRGLYHISHHHNCNASLHCLMKNIKNSKILVYLTQYHRFALLLTKLTKYLFVYSWVRLNAKMSSFCMDACTETFATLIKSMTSMNWSSILRRSGMAWDKASLITQWVSGTHVSGRVFM